MLKTVDHSVSPSIFETGSAEHPAVSLLQLLARVEAAASKPQSLREHFAASHSAHFSNLSVYQEELLETVTQAIFSSVNDDFYAAYKGYGPEKLFEIVVSQEDLRPLAYRALTHSGQNSDDPSVGRPFSPRFAQALLLLQKHWNSEFLQPYKDVAGNLSAYSIKRRQLTLAFDR